MSREDLHWTSPLASYERQAEALFAHLESGDEAAAWRFKWEHPQFRKKTVHDVRAATLALSDARMVVAQEHSFATWADLEAFTRAVASDPRVLEFEAAVEALLDGDLATLRSMLERNPELVRARSTRRHHATLLHYLGANGVEGERQRTPANAVEVMRMLLGAGAEPDALADLYDHKCTTMSMIVSSTHPHQAGLQAALAETLLDYGAAHDGPGTNWQSAVLTALAFGYRETAEALARRGAPIHSLPVAAGLGRLDETRRFLPSANADEKQIALALAAQHGHAAIVELLLDAGTDPNRFNPDGYHAHSTPMHQAAWSNHIDVVRLLVEHGARLDLQDEVYQATPLGWAVYGERTAIAEYLRSKEG